MRGAGHGGPCAAHPARMRRLWNWYLDRSSLHYLTGFLLSVFVVALILTFAHWIYNNL